MNVSITQHNWNVLHGTINAGGTLTNEIDLEGYTEIGLYYTGIVNGTISFQVSNIPDAQGGTYVDLKKDDGSTLTIGPSGTSGAITGVALAALKPYRYAKIKITAQDNGAVFKVPVKA